MREMKDSGIEWIGEIPKGWETRKIKYLYKLRDEKNYESLQDVQLLSLYTELGVFPHGEQEERGNKAITAEGYKIVYENDIVVNIILAWMGAIGMSQYNGVTSPAYDIYIPYDNVANSKFYHYLFRTSMFSGECYRYGRGIMAMRWRTYSTEFKSIIVPFPTYEKQTAIANYLDDKCGKIDVTIQREKQHIEKLKEYRQSVITEAVTKGLDPTVPMKDSGIEWIGQVPQGWKIIRLRFLCEIETGSKDTINRIDDGQYPFYVRSPNIEKINSYSFDGEAILMAGDGVGAGKVFHYVNGKFDYHQRVYNLHYFKGINAKFLFNYLSENFWKEIEKGNAKSTVDSIRLPMILNFPICVTKETEQTTIADYLDHKTARIDSAIAKKEMLIERLTEYKKSLIYEAVTGKVEVS